MRSARTSTLQAGAATETPGQFDQLWLLMCHRQLAAGRQRTAERACVTRTPPIVVEEPLRDHGRVLPA